MTVEEELAALTASISALTSAVNLRKAALDAAIASAESSAQTAITVSSAAQANATAIAQAAAAAAAAEALASASASVTAAQAAAATAVTAKDTTVAAARVAPYSGLGYVIDNGGDAIPTGLHGGGILVPFDCTITEVYLIGDVSGSVVVDIWKAPFASYPPVLGNSICASAKPTLSGAQKGSDSTLTGWSKTISAGDVLFFNVDSCTSISRLNIIIGVQKV